MKWLLALVLFLASFSVQAETLAFLPYSTGAVPLCPNPTQIGATILPNTPCTLTDGLGQVWRFCAPSGACPALGTTLYRDSKEFAGGAPQAQLNTGGGAFPTGRVFWQPSGCKLTVWIK